MTTTIMSRSRPWSAPASRSGGFRLRGGGSCSPGSEHQKQPPVGLSSHQSKSPAVANPQGGFTWAEVNPVGESQRRQRSAAATAGRLGQQPSRNNSTRLCGLLQSCRVGLSRRQAGGEPARRESHRRVNARHSVVRARATGGAASARAAATQPGAPATQPGAPPCIRVAGA